MASNVSSPSSSTIVGEYIGIESCLDLKNEEDIFTPSSNKEETNYESCSTQRCHREKREQRWAKKKEFPPPIPLLARTENLPSHMPWILKRYYTSDGRLILREEKVRRHEYFRAHRSNGRLTLHLVPLDDDVSAPPFVGDERRHGIENDIDQCYDNEDDGEEELVLEQEHEEDKEENESLVEESIDVKVNDKDGVENDYFGNNVDSGETIEVEEEEEEEEAVHDDQRVPSMESSESAGKCLNYNSVRTSSTCIFGVPVPAIRPVHT
ncbi:hypothetical protein POTOM_007838 [Populus tomentosa]|uniref:FAF domain-containing protein n=1 Tax=Populus tomentosa TaxID=118781 RepID=A0A8X8ACZ3_POPTO|nr:hypothetical protein POTOM_007838 [Populus tomentosa]